MPKRKASNSKLLEKGVAELFLDVLKQEYGRNDIEFIYKENADGIYETIAIEGGEIDMGWRPFLDNIPQAVLNNHYAKIRLRIDKLLEESGPKSKSKKPRKTSIRKTKKFES
tara:strand:- start:108 stop:443 length:336 start_codon:yes stop_codon:yes gene_type:complete